MSVSAVRNALPSFSCPRYCKHRECRRHATSPVLEEVRECLCLGVVNGSSLTLRLVRDMATTLSDIMIICGIPRCKAKQATDVISGALIQCENIYFCIDAHTKKRLRKHDLRQQLASRCGLSSAEVQLASVIVEQGFKAFYYVPTSERFNRYRHSQPVPHCMPQFMEECAYHQAARNTALFYSSYGGLSQVETRRYAAKLKELYGKCVQKMQDYFVQAPCEGCNCCLCVKNRAACEEVPPIRPKRRIRLSYKCGWTRQRIPGAIHIATRTQMLERQRKAAAAAAAAKARATQHQFTPKWVKSIWTRPDFHAYYQEEIAEFAGPVQKPRDYCRPLTEAEVEERMAAAELAMNPPQVDSLEEFCARISH